jgi:hypothetical protein
MKSVRTQEIRIKVTEHEKKLLTQEAFRSGMPVSSWLRWLGWQRADKYRDPLHEDVKESEG